jgi:hypothetical protein
VRGRERRPPATFEVARRDGGNLRQRRRRGVVSGTQNADGSLTLQIQKDPPSKDQEPNWLPAPNGPPYVVMRVYWPKEAALNGTWQPPAVQRIK